MDPELSYRAAVLSLRLKTVIFPIDTREFLRELQKARGFVLTSDAAGRGVPLEGMLTGDPLARKGDIALGIDAERHIVRLHGPDPTALLPEWLALEEMLDSRFGIDSQRVYFFEMIASLTIRTGNDPTRVFAALSPKDIMSGAANALGEKTVLYGLRFSAPGDPNRDTWFDVRIEPDVQAATLAYFAQTIYRSAKKEAMHRFAESLDEKVSALVRFFEESVK